METPNILNTQVGYIIFEILQFLEHFPGSIELLHILIFQIEAQIHLDFCFINILHCV